MHYQYANGDAFDMNETHSPTDSPVNLSRLHEICDGDREMQSELFGEYLLELRRQLSAAEKALAAKANEDAGRIFHQLKGMSYNVGANEMGRLASEANDAANNDQTMEMDRLLTEFERVSRFLRREFDLD